MRGAVQPTRVVGLSCGHGAALPPGRGACGRTGRIVKASAVAVYPVGAAVSAQKNGPAMLVAGKKSAQRRRGFALTGTHRAIRFSARYHFCDYLHAFHDAYGGNVL